MKIVTILKSDNNNTLLFVSLFISVIIASIIGREPIWYPLSFMAAQYLLVYLPGRVLADYVNIQYSNNISRCFVSYAIGFVLSIIIYILFLLLNIHSYILYFYGVLSLALLYVRYKRIIQNENKNSDKCGTTLFKEKICVISVLSVAFIIGCFTFQMVNLPSSLFVDGSDSSIHYDLMFWMRNSVAATVSYPLPDLSVAGQSLYYHYFTSIEIAFLHYVTGIEIYDLCFTYSYLVTLFLMVSGVYVLARKLIHNNFLLFTCICFLVFTANLESFSLICLSTHLFVSSFGLAEALGIFCITLYAYLEYRESGFSNNLNLFTILFLFFGLVGLKSPIALVFCLVLGVDFLFTIFKKGEWKSMLLLLSGFAAIFFLVNAFFVIGIFNQQSVQDGSNMDLGISLTGTVHLFSDEIFENYLGISLPLFLRFIISYLVFFVTAFFVPVLLLVNLAFYKQSFNKTRYDNILLSCTILGVVLSIIIDHAGRSQMYFVFPSIICLLIWIFIKMDQKTLFRSNRYVLVCSFIIGVLSFLGQNYHIASMGLSKFLRTISMSTISASYSVQELSCKSIDKLDRRFRSDVMTSENSGISVSGLEIQGLRWVRDNLPRQTVLLSNKLFGLMDRDKYNMSELCMVKSDPLKVTSSHTTIVSCFSERQTFMEGYYFSNLPTNIIFSNLSEIMCFYNGDDESVESIKRKGVEYAIVFKRITPNNYPDGCEVIYDNKDLIVVKI